MILVFALPVNEQYAEIVPFFAFRGPFLVPFSGKKWSLFGPFKGLNSSGTRIVCTGTAVLHLVLQLLILALNCTLENPLQDPKY